MSRNVKIALFFFFSVWMIRTLVATWWVVWGNGSGSDPANSSPPRLKPQLRANLSTPQIKDIRQVIIIGGGVAGLSAGVYTSRAGIDTVIISEGSSQLSMTSNVQNYPGVPPTTGVELLLQISKQATGTGAVLYPSSVKQIETSTYPFQITTGNNSILYAWAVILATGASPRWPKLRNELKYMGRYIHSCPLCDGSLYTDKRVVVIGGGDSAFEAVLYLAKLVSVVTVLHRREQWKASEILRSKLPKNVVLRPGVEPMSWEGTPDDILTGITFRDTSTNKEETLQIDGAFIAIGNEPSTSYLTSTDVRLEPTRHVTVFDSIHTTVEGIYAAGEVSDSRFRQAVTAASMGAMAAIEVEKWLLSIKQCGVSGHLVTPPPPPVTQRPSKQVAFDLECEEIARSCLDAFVNSHAVVIFSKTYCPYCTTAKEMIASLNIADVAVIELDTSPRGSAVHDVLKKKTGRRTVPNIFVRGRNIGGSEELAKELPFLELLLKKNG